MIQAFVVHRFVVEVVSLQYNETNDALLEVDRFVATTDTNDTLPDVVRCVIQAFVVETFIDETVSLQYNETNDALPDTLMSVIEAFVIDTFIAEMMSLEYTHTNDAVSTTRYVVDAFSELKVSWLLLLLLLL